MPDNQLSPLPLFWKLPDGRFLMAAWTQPWPHSGVYDVFLPDGTALEGVTRYYVVSAQGVCVEAYPAPGVYSLEDFLYLHDLFAVMGDRLCRFLWWEQWGYGTRTDLRAVILEGLVPCPVTDLPFDPAQITPG
ncbi:MAG: hypothetical protein M3Y28_08575 [Armatimonadota bacterium]|nr:hypothetical protein [Armatimonadota bacterium]